MIEKFKGALVPVIRSSSVDEALAIAGALARANLRFLEITINNEHGARAIGRLSDQGDPNLIIGAGSVLNEAAARAACESGASFLVSPGYSERVHAVATNRDVLYVPGMLTPTEIMRARDNGLEFLKLFPAGAVGPSFLKDLAGPFPGLKIMPTGGVNLDNLGDYFKAGAHCIGVGGSLLKKELIAAGNWNELTRHAETFNERLREVISGN